MTFTAQKTVNSYLRQYHNHYTRYTVGTYDNIQNTDVTWGQTNSRTGVGLVGWRKIIQSRGNATTPLSGDEYSFKATYGDAYSYVPWNPPRISTSSGFSSHFLSSMNTNRADSIPAEQQAYREFYRKVREHRSKFQGGVFVGELGEALRMLRRPGKTLFEGIDSFLSNAAKRAAKLPAKRKGAGSKKFNLKRRHSFSKVLSDTWLEASFGWKPLLNDISEASDALEAVLNDSPFKIIRGVGYNEEYTPPQILANEWGSAIPVTLHSNRCDHKVIVIYAGALQETPYGVGPQKILKDLGFHIQDFVPTIWELIPWSFLVDYFTNIGDILESATTDTSSVRFCYRTTVHINKVYVNAFLNEAKMKSDWGSNAQVGGYLPSSVHTWKGVSRASIGLPPIPDFRVEVPGRPQQWLNMLTLATSSRKVQSFF